LKLGSTGAGRAARFLLLLVFSVCWILEVHAGPLKFVQVTDLHLYDKEEAAANKTALIDCIQKINELSEDGDDFEFVVVTGDIGIEGLLKDLYQKEVQLNKREEELKAKRDLSKDLKDELDKIPLRRTQIHLQIDNRIIASAMEVADILNSSSTKRWLFLPGNNDLIDEDAGTIEYYTRFVQELRAQLINKKEIRNLSGNEGPYIKDSHVFVGFNNASFKNNDDPERITDKQYEDISIEDVKHRISTKEGQLSTVSQKQSEYITQVSQVVDQYRSNNVYILFHIPEVDDSHPVLNFNSDAVNKRLLSINEPYAVSAWFVDGKVRRQWHDMVDKSQVKALLAGHFHDWRFKTYEGYDWMRTPESLYAGMGKLHICPPLAIKRQEDANQEARGFQVVSIDDAGKADIERWWYYSSTHTFNTTAPGATLEGKAMKILEQIVALVGHLAWPIVAILILLVLRKQLRDIFHSVASRVSDPSSQLSVGDWLTIKNSVAANSGNIEALQLGFQVVRAGVLKPSPEAPVSSSPQDELWKLADEYLNMNIRDHGARIFRKNQLATEMGILIIQHRISREWVAAQDNQGLKAGLASAINALPMEGDLNLLLKASDKVTKLHVMYRIVVALGRLFEIGIATSADATGVMAVLEIFMRHADAPLKRRIEQTRSIMELALKAHQTAA
jgi:Calcineurin-like phosphoesterase